MFRVLSKQPRFYSLRSRFFSNDCLSDKSTMRYFHIKENLQQASFLKAIKKASIEKESLQSSIVNSSENEGLQAITLSDNKYEFDDNSIMPSTLYIRDFYSRLLDSLLSTKNSILLGNPGVLLNTVIPKICLHLRQSRRGSINLEEFSDM